MSESKRKFEQISTVHADLPLPKRSTAHSAGYDISIIHPVVYDMITDPDSKITSLDDAWKEVIKYNDSKNIFYLPEGKTNYVFPTGIKAKMPLDKQEVLMLFVRSSIGIKQGVKLSNQTGIIDADYYNNPDNEGHIMVALDIPKRRIPDTEPTLFTEDEYNMANYLKFDGPTMRVCQGIFLDYETTDDDEASGNRVGGIGSTGR